MSAKTASPTAHLLRNSRFFSMPRPLPLPQSDLQGHLQSNKSSDTATLPYPIQQAIATTPAALGRGDWGLKRPLPLRSTTRTSTPVFRLNAIDTREHITDYESASDLTLNLQKLQELQMSVTTNPQKTAKSMKSIRRNVFDQSLDNTQVASAEESGARWKFNGPWVAGMTQGEFTAYVEKQLKGRKAEFNRFLRDHARKAIETNRKASRRHEGFDSAMGQTSVAADTVDEVEAEADTDQPVDLDNVTRKSEQHAIDNAEAQHGKPATIPEEEINTYIKTLRNNFALSSELAVLIQRFLDLPSVFGSDLDRFQHSFYEQGPPKTHPSGGVSYLRSDAFLDNHPLFGPQRNRTPQEARLLSSGPKGLGATGEGQKLGVAGVVSNNPRGSGRAVRSNPKPAENNAMEKQDEDMRSIGLATKGGNRQWVAPTSLHLNSRGRIKLETQNADMTAVGVLSGELQEPTFARQPKRQPMMGYDEMPMAGQFSPRKGAPAPVAGRNAYGLGRGTGGQAGAKNGPSSLLDMARQDMDRHTQRRSRDARASGDR